jgi:lipopolysaccharide biosynthesis glycosyltransferase
MPSDQVLDIFIGYDAREDEAFRVCRRSLIRRSDSPLHIQSLSIGPLQHSGLFRRTWHDVEGQRFDDLDGKPFSTDFSFTRFLVPALKQYRGWAMFVDCDFAFMGDVAEIFAAADDTKAVMVCKQLHQPNEAVKMDGMLQGTYKRKNWSSLILWNCGHPSNKLLTTEAVNREPGSWLHGFGWLKDDDIGELDARWNWIEGVTQGEPKAVHYTKGGPWFPEYQDVPYAGVWNRELMLANHYEGID